MKTQDMKNEDMLEILQGAREHGDAYPLKRDYITQVANVVYGKVSIIVFTNSMAGITRTSLTSAEVRELVPYEYYPVVNDHTRSIILRAVQDVYQEKGYMTELHTDTQGNAQELIITVAE